MSAQSNFEFFGTTFGVLLPDGKDLTMFPEAVMFGQANVYLYILELDTFTYFYYCSAVKT